MLLLLTSLVQLHMLGVTVSEQAGSYGTYKSNANYGRHFKNGLKMILSDTYYNSHGHDRLYFPSFDSPDTNNGIAENIDHDRADQLFANLSWGNFTLEGVYSSRLKQIPTASYGSLFNDPSTNTSTRGNILIFSMIVTLATIGGSWPAFPMTTTPLTLVERTTFRRSAFLHAR